MTIAEFGFWLFVIATLVGPCFLGIWICDLLLQKEQLVLNVLRLRFGEASFVYRSATL